MDLATAVERVGAAGTGQNHRIDRCLGSRDEALRRAAEAASGGIGIVVVDHGQAGCGTPAAVPCLSRTPERKLAGAGA